MRTSPARTADRPRTSLRVLVVAATAALALSGCASTAPRTASEADTVTGSRSQPAADAVKVTDAWVKSADSGMSAAFGELNNTGMKEVTVVSAESATSPMIELHETVADDSGAMVMRQKKCGFTIPAGGSLTLEPGGNHIMLMDLTAPLKAGDEATFTLTFSDKTTTTFAAPVKDFTGAEETYVGGGDAGMDMDGMDMGSDG